MNASFMTVPIHTFQSVFEMCAHSTSKTKIFLFRLISFFTAFIMPAFLLANYVYYRQLGYARRRELQTAEAGGGHAFRARIFQVGEMRDDHYKRVRPSWRPLPEKE